MTDSRSASPAEVADLLQEGIYFRSKQAPARCYRLLLLDVAPGTSRDDARRGVTVLWRMLSDLRAGVVEDLKATAPGDPEPQLLPGGLTVLLGYGPRFFRQSVHQPTLTSAPQPGGLNFRAPGGAGDAGPFRSLHWVDGMTVNPADADLALQFIADTELAVNRAIVEVRKRLGKAGLPLTVRTFFSGFHREDGRSWIDFHDGVNTMREDERRVAMTITLDDPSWLEGGTFMAFLKIAVNLDAWQNLPRRQQEALVGRDKLTGCPIVRIDETPDLVPHVIATCPGTAVVSAAMAPPEYINPPRPHGELATSAHIYRSNLNRGDPGLNANNRIYRQGYEFLDPPGDAPDVRAGLNFVSFQRTTKFVENILEIGEWMGEVNFGGPVSPEGEQPPPIPLMSLLAGGFFAVPPRGEPFPGSSLLDL